MFHYTRLRQYKAFEVCWNINTSPIASASWSFSMTEVDQPSCSSWGKTLSKDPGELQNGKNLASHLTDVWSSLFREIFAQVSCVQILHPAPKYNRLVWNVVEQRKNLIPKKKLSLIPSSQWWLSSNLASLLQDSRAGILIGSAQALVGWARLDIRSLGDTNHASKQKQGPWKPPQSQIVLTPSNIRENLPIQFGRLLPPQSAPVTIAELHGGHSPLFLKENLSLCHVEIVHLEETSEEPLQNVAKMLDFEIVQNVQYLEHLVNFHLNIWNIWIRKLK